LEVMSTAHDPAENRSAFLTSSIRPTADWRVRKVKALPDYRLKVRFADGLEGLVDMKKMVWSSGAGVFEALRDPAVFSQAQVALGVVTWPGELDLAPDAMYDEINAHGEWVLD
jgi:hypothetical protein